MLISLKLTLALGTSIHLHIPGTFKSHIQVQVNTPFSGSFELYSVVPVIASKFLIKLLQTDFLHVNSLLILERHGYCILEQ